MDAGRPVSHWRTGALAGACARTTFPVSTRTTATWLNQRILRLSASLAPLTFATEVQASTYPMLMWLVVGVLVWIALSVPTALVVGGMIGRGERRMRPDVPAPARRELSRVA